MNYKRYAASPPARATSPLGKENAGNAQPHAGFHKNFRETPAKFKNLVYDAASFDGLVAQLVEQRIENPRVGGSIPPQATILLFQHASKLPKSSKNQCLRRDSLPRTSHCASLHPQFAGPLSGTPQ
jgi:hypothetical protein